MNLNTILLNEFTDEMTTTRNFLEAISDDSFDFSPHEKSNNLGGLVKHVLPIPTWIPMFTQAPELDWSKATPPEIPNTKAEILAQFDKNVAVGKKALEETNNDQLMEACKMRSGDTILFSGRKETAVRRYVFNHIIHHRAQLGIYLRLNNLEVPGSYVKSADNNLF